MALPALAAVAGGGAAAAYLDAKFHIRHDIEAGVLDDPVAQAQKHIAERQAQGRLLVYHLMEHNALSHRSDCPFLEYEGWSWTYKQFYDCLQSLATG